MKGFSLQVFQLQHHRALRARPIRRRPAAVFLILALAVFGQHRADQVAAGKLGSWPAEYQVAVPQHADAVSDGQDFVQAVGNKENPNTPAGQFVQDDKKRVDLAKGQR